MLHLIALWNAILAIKQEKHSIFSLLMIDKGAKKIEGWRMIFETLMPSRVKEYFREPFKRPESFSKQLQVIICETPWEQNNLQGKVP